MRITVGNQERAAAVLIAAGATVRIADDHLIVGGVTSPQWLNSILGGHDLWASEITAVRADLETVFLDLTEGAS